MGLIGIPAFCQNNSNPQGYKTEYVIRESNGESPWWDILHVAKARYKNLTPSISFGTAPDGSIIQYKYLNCEDPGDVKCKWSSADRTPTPTYVDGLTINGCILDNNVDELLTEIDDILYNGGPSSGSVSKKISVVCNGKTYIVLMVAFWTEGNANCDALVRVTMSDITNIIR